MSLRTNLLPDVRKPGGLLQMLGIALPLVMASAGHGVNLFADRVMLAQYSQEAVGAAFPSGLTNFTISCFFLGTIGYASSFVAQYTGAGVFRRVGESVWQAVWLSLLGGVVMASGWFFAEPLFALFGHAEVIQKQEVVYFKILSLGSFVPLLFAGLSAFWGGQGKTVLIMLDSVFVALVNIPLNYALIFGHWGSPELGIAGAALGTVLSGILGLVVYGIFFFTEEARKTYGTWPPKFDFPLFRRMIRFGAPNGGQLFLDLLAFNIFIILLGLVGNGDEENIRIQEAATIAFSLNSIAFTPMLGIGQTVSILVGQCVGSGELANARRTVRTGRAVTSVYMLSMAVLFVFFPDPLIDLFARTGDTAQEATMAIARNFMKFIAAYTFFDGIVIVYSSAIKGAGDTKFAMYGSAGLAWMLCVVPCGIAWICKAGVYTYWTILDIYIITTALVFFLRYVQGKWRKMRVIEDSCAKPVRDED